MNTCIIKNCNNKVVAKGLCSKHYAKNYKYGNPLHCKIETHGMSKSLEYMSWYAMKQRCTNKNNLHYPRYGARGITVCDRWLHSFNNFYKDMGVKPFPKAELDRKKNDKGYYKSNCRWVTGVINRRNASTIKLSIEIAREIRAKYALGNITQKELGYYYNVSRPNVGSIIKNKIWKEL